MWSPETVRQILHNYTYLGHLVQLRTRTVSYKNHKVIKNDEEDMIVVKNTHEAIVSQELWDRVRVIYIYYKLLDEPLKDRRSLF